MCFIISQKVPDPKIIKTNLDSKPMDLRDSRRL